MSILLTVIGSLWCLWLLMAIALGLIAIYAPARPALPLDSLDIWLRRVLILGSMAFSGLFVCSVGINFWR